MHKAHTGIDLVQSAPTMVIVLIFWFTNFSDKMAYANSADPGQLSPD